MARSWQTARIFISSTFLDMQAERDHLVRFVFPRLREALLTHRIHVDDVDLRWGVNEDDAVSACLRIIDDCAPHFLAMLGDRYGFVPEGDDRSITAQEIAYGALNRPQDRAHHLFCFRDAGALASIPPDQRESYCEPDGTAKAEGLVRLKADIAEAGYTPVVYSCRWDDAEARLVDLEAFGEAVYRHLLASITQAYHLDDDQPLTEFEEEAVAMENFIESRTRHYVLGSRAPLIGDLRMRVLDPGGRGVLLLVGEAGIGKTALMSRFALDLMAETRLQPPPQPRIVLIHFVGASAASTDPQQMLRRLSHDLIASAGIADARDFPDSYEEQCDRFEELLAEACKSHQVILLIDAINQLEPEPSSITLRWLPETIPSRARLILTSQLAPNLTVIRTRAEFAGEMLISDLTAEDGTLIVEQFLSRYNKSLDAAQRGRLLAKKDADKPLYLLTALEELRTLGSPAAITRQIETLPEEIQPLFQWILRRLEADPGFHDGHNRPIGKALVRGFFTYLVTGRGGMAERELIDLLAPGDPDGNIAALERLTRPLLFFRGALLGFFHGQFQAAVEAAYLTDAASRTAAHRLLADYFRRQAGDWRESGPRPLGELLYHLMQSKDFADLQALYANADFLTAFCAKVNVRTGTDRGSLAVHGGIIELLAHLRGLIEAQPESGRERAELSHLFRLLRMRARLLQVFPRSLPQEIVNYAEPERFARPLLDTALAQPGDPLLLANRDRLPREANAHSARITALTLAPDGVHFLAGAKDGSLGYWHIDEPDPLWLLTPHKSWVASVAISPDGKRALSVGDEGSVYLWELELGLQLMQIFPRSHYFQWFQKTFGAFLDDDTVLVTGGSICYSIDLRANAIQWQKTGITYGYMERSDAGTTLYRGLGEDASRLGTIIGDSGKDVLTLSDPRDGTILHTSEGVPQPNEIVLFSRDGTRVLVANHRTQMHAFTADAQPFAGGTMRPLSALCVGAEDKSFWCYTVDGELLKIALDRRFDITPVNLPDPLLLRVPIPTRMVALPDNRRLLIGRDDGWITLFDTREMRVTREWKSGDTLVTGAIFPAGQGALGIRGQRSGDNTIQGNAVIFIQPNSQQKLVESSPHDDFITGAAVLDDQQAFTVDKNGRAVLWRNGRVSKSERIPKMATTSCAVWEEGKSLVGGGESEHVFVWGARTSPPVEMRCNNNAYAVGIPALAAAGSEPPGIFATYYNNLVRFRRGHQQWTGPEATRHNFQGTAAALDPACRYAADGNLTGEVRLWRCGDGKLLAEFPLHENPVSALAFSGDGGILYSAALDRLIYGIDTASGKLIFATLVASPIIALRFDGGALFALDTAGRVYPFRHASEHVKPGEVQRPSFRDKIGRLLRSNK
ncbi:MAG: DUF4062 domain-containing protein [Chloroflexi bacterium]|nr:DUF4062 domain-containing protein [Chloroflexota bacterium]